MFVEWGGSGCCDDVGCGDVGGIVFEGAVVGVAGDGVGIRDGYFLVADPAARAAFEDAPPMTG